MLVSIYDLFANVKFGWSVIDNAGSWGLLNPIIVLKLVLIKHGLLLDCSFGLLCSLADSSLELILSHFY